LVLQLGPGAIGVKRLPLAQSSPQGQTKGNFWYPPICLIEEIFDKMKS